jgi:membrane protein DedA with SNARE-associated domain
MGALSAFGVDLSWAAKLASLLVLPFAHHDLAILAGAYCIVNHVLPVGLVAVAIYGGIVGSDFTLYGIGAGARHLPWLRKFAINRRAHRFGDLLKRNLFELILLCRLVPGAALIVFVACGWARVSLPRFAAGSLVISALYLPLLLYLLTMFGDALDDHVGLWAWPLLLGALIAVGIARYRVFTFRDPSEIATAAAN